MSLKLDITVLSKDELVDKIFTLRKLNFNLKTKLALNNLMMTLHDT